MYKKLLAAGERRIVEFAKVFRNRERGALHPPEFTLIEWYRAGEPYRTLMGDCVTILRTAAARRRGPDADVPRQDGGCLCGARTHQRRGCVQALCRHRSLGTLDGSAPDRDGFARAAQAAGICIADDDHWGDIFSRVLVERIEGNLGIGRVTILDEYPAVLSALARPAADPRVAERFELYAWGSSLRTALAS